MDTDTDIGMNDYFLKYMKWQNIITPLANGNITMTSNRVYLAQAKSKVVKITCKPKINKFLSSL